MNEITGGGAFTFQNIDDLNENFLFLTAHVNVLAYGAVGNGIDDDTAAITRAQAAAAVSTHVVFFPAGTYTARVILVDGVHLVSDGEAVIQDLSESAGSTVTDNNVAVAVKLRGIRFYRANTHAPANSHALWIQHPGSVIESDVTASCESGDIPYSNVPVDENGAAILNYGTISGLKGTGTTCYGFFNYGLALDCRGDSTRNAGFVNRGQDAIAVGGVGRGIGALSLCGFWNGDGNANVGASHSTATAIGCTGLCDSTKDTADAFSNEGEAYDCIGRGYGVMGWFNRGGRAFGCKGYGKRRGNLTSWGFLNIGHAEDCTGESDGWWSGFYNHNTFQGYPAGVAIGCTGSVLIEDATGYNQSFIAGFLNESACKALNCYGVLDVPDTITEAYALRTAGSVLGGRFESLGANAAIKVVGDGVVLDEVHAVCENGTVAWIAADAAKILGGSYRSNKAEATVGILFSNGVVAKVVGTHIFTNTVSGSACMKGLGGVGSPNAISYVGIRTNTSPVFVTQSATATPDARGNIIDAGIY